MYRQKALDLKMPAALPKLIFHKRTRGIEEVEKDSEDEADAEESDDEGEREAATKMNKNIGKFGDTDELKCEIYEIFLFLHLVLFDVFINEIYT